MINPSELRLGNLINYNGEPMPVYSIDRGGRSFYRINDIAVNKKTGCTINGGEDVYGAIPLTEEWLIGFGFAKDGAPNCYTNGDFVIFTKNDANDIHSPYVPCGKWIVIMEYVHQLQNLCHALTGEELSLKELIS